MLRHILISDRFLKQGEYIGFIFSGITNDLVHVCMTGRKPECGKFAFKEYAKFAVSTGADVGAAVTLSACAAIGIATVGVGGVACAAVGSSVAGYIGSSATEEMMDSLYQYIGI